MSQAPILPPLPPGYGPSSQSSSRPPLPPLPQGYHNSNPDVVAPRPQRTTPAVPTSHLETQAASWGPAQPQRAPSPFIPGPLVSSAYGASPYIPQQPATPPVAPPYGAPQQGRPMHQPAATPGFPGYGSPAGNMPIPTQSRPPRQSSSMNLTANFNNLTIDDRRASSPAVQLSSYPGQGSPKQFGPPPVAPRMGPPQLPKPLTQKDLSAMRELVVSSDDLGKRVQWAKEVLKFVERSQAAATTASAIVDPLLIQWIEQAMQYISFGAGSDPGPSTVPPSLLQLAVAEAMFLRADLASSGTFPTYFPKNPRSSFRDFEASANLGFAESWFKIGKAYESFDNFRSAVDAYNRGVRLGESHCLFVSFSLFWLWFADLGRPAYPLALDGGSVWEWQLCSANWTYVPTHPKPSEFSNPRHGPRHRTTRNQHTYGECSWLANSPRCPSLPVLYRPTLPMGGNGWNGPRRWAIRRLSTSVA